jgi:hypothetical protein
MRGISWLAEEPLASQEPLYPVDKVAMGRVFLQVLQFLISVSFHQCSILIHSSTTDGLKCFSSITSVSPVSITPPMLHTHSFIYRRRCIMFFFHYFSFPCQYHSTIAPYSFIPLPPTLYNVFLPVLQFPLSVSFHHCSTPTTNTM